MLLLFCRPATRAHALVPRAAPCFARRTFTSLRTRSGSSAPAVEKLDVRRLAQRSEEYHRYRRLFMLSGALAGAVAFVFTAWKLKQALAKNPTRLDSNLAPTDPLVAADAAARKVVVHDADGREVVPTANSTVEHFPRTIHLPSDGPGHGAASSTDPAQGSVTAPLVNVPATEYTLVGLGLRTVSFLSIPVYIVGYYVATADIAALQSALVKKVNPIATTLVPGERDQLRFTLLDSLEGEETWRELLSQGIPARSLFRVVPVRDTDFHHLRDGFVRAIQAKSSSSGPNDDGLGEAVRDFRALFNRGSVAKKKELLLVRDGDGRLHVLYDDGEKSDRQLLGTVDDERISTALWLNYLAGKKVASEPARKSIVEGIMEFVERPVGTVATQVL